MTKFGMPGVFTHGTFDTWTPGYLMFIATMHNGISRLYETFGNGGADTVERTLQPGAYSRTWYRQNPPLPKAMWSQRNNNNYQQTGLLVSLHHFTQNRQLFLRNFYLKSKRSILKAKTEGPAAYVFTATDPRPGLQADLLRVLQKQGCEVSRATAAFTVEVGKKKPAPRETTMPAGNDGQEKKPETKDEPQTREFPAGSYIVRMDQPYSRIADALLDYQYWAPDEPQRNPYDDTGWTFGELFGVDVARVTDAKVLDVAVEKVTGDVNAPGDIRGSGGVYVVNHNADPSLATLRYRLKNASFEAAEDGFEAEGRKFNRGSFVIRNVDRTEMEKAAAEAGLTATALTTAPAVKTHPVKAARVALLHTWLSTQDEGWWRMTLDQFHIPYDYLSTQDIAKDANLNAKYDVMLFAPVGRGGQAIISGLPMWGNPLPWKTTPETPNLGKIDETDDMRPGLGLGRTREPGDLRQAQQSAGRR